MTEIAFHFNIPDKLPYACRLLRKVVASGKKAVVTGDARLLGELDVALWTFAPLDFIAHCRAPGSPEALLGASPVVLTGEARSAPHQEVLVNLGEAVPDGFEAFERLIEVVTEDEADRARARRRWKHYAARGYAIVRHDRAREAQ